MARLHIYKGMNFEEYLTTVEPGPWNRCQECGVNRREETILDSGVCIPCHQHGIYTWNQETGDNLCSRVEQ